MPFGRRIAPALSVLQTDVEVVDACGGTNRAAGLTVAPENHTHGSPFLHRFGSNILTFRRSVLLRRRQCNPQLEGAQRLARRGPAVMPHAVTGFHPLEATRRDRALLSGRVLVSD